MIQETRVQEKIENRNKVQFTASTMNIIAIYQLISSTLAFGRNSFLNITENGLCFSVTDNNVCKVVLTLDRKLFTSYLFNPKQKPRQASDSDIDHSHTELRRLKKEVRSSHGANSDADTDASTTDDDTNDELAEEEETNIRSVSLNLDLKSLVETINIHIPSEKDSWETRTKCILSYQGEGSPFILTFEDEFIVERCELSTLFLDPTRIDRISSKKTSGRPSNVISADSQDSFNESYNELYSDNSIFQLDSSKVMFEIVLKASILYDVLKDMKDLSTDEFIVYCSNDHNRAGLSKNAHSGDSGVAKKLIFISRSEDDSIGFSKLIVPDKKPFLKDMQLFRPMLKSDPNDDNELQLPEERVEMIPCMTNVSSFYNFNYYSKIMKAIKLSKLIKIRKDMNGLTSMSLLVGSSSLGGTHHSSGDQKSLYYGTSIEFITLESLSLEDRLGGLIKAMESQETTFSSADRLAKYGYNNHSIEQMIQDDDNIKIIKITGDGQLTTIDDYFPRENSHGNRGLEPEVAGNRELIVTHELAQSVLGHNALPDRNNEETTADVPEERPKKGQGKRARNDKNGGGKKLDRQKKKKGEDIQTVGGAIEIPLFI